MRDSHSPDLMDRETYNLILDRVLRRIEPTPHKNMHTSIPQVAEESEEKFSAMKGQWHDIIVRSEVVQEGTTMQT